VNEKIIEENTKAREWRERFNELHPRWTLYWICSQLPDHLSTNRKQTAEAKWGDK